MLSPNVEAAISQAADQARPLLERRRFREIHRDAEIAGQAVLDAHPETKGRKWEGRSRKAYEHRPEMNGIHWRIISAAITRPGLLALSRTKMLTELSELFGFPIKRYVIENPLKRKPVPGTTDGYWLTRQIARKLSEAGQTGLKKADLRSVETVLKVLAKRLLPPKETTICRVGTIEIDYQGRTATMLGHAFRLHPTATGKLRIEGEDAKVSLDALLALVSEAKSKGKKRRERGEATKR